MKNILRLLYLSLFTMSTAFASPGAHGPNGEHLDATGAGHAHDDTGPRIETFTRSFELVGHVQGDELSMLIDRYETNEPVLNGKLEVEANGIKATATFHADHGDYAVDDAQFLEAIAAPGKHALVFTLMAGGESDLLQGTLEVNAADSAHGHADDHARSLTRWTVAGGLLAAALTVLAIRLLRRKTRTGK
jgi:hypothetical protein